MASSPASSACAECGGRHAYGEACRPLAGIRIGTVVDDKYELVRLIGQGGMGEVYEGRHRVIGRRVAVKFLLSEYARNPEVAVRFENEARAAGGTEHENVAGVYDVGSLADGTKYLVMEFLDGEDVDRLVQRDAPVPTARAAFIVIQACRGLDVVHQRGIVHRDLKPANLFLVKRADKTDLVKVLDFGIAKLRSLDGRETKTGAAIGTASYMSPEQARGEREVDSRSDVYSLGVILYELLSGKTPHEGDSLLQILHKVMTQPPLDLEALRPGLSPGVYGVVRRAMAASAADRYQSVAELGDALIPFVGRALPAIRSQPGDAHTPIATIDTEPHVSSASATGVRPSAPDRVGGSVVGVTRSEPVPLPDAIPGLGRSRASLVVGLLGAVVVAGVVVVWAFAPTRQAGLAPLESAGGLVASPGGLVSPASAAGTIAASPVPVASDAPWATVVAGPSPNVALPSGDRTGAGRSPIPGVAQASAPIASAANRVARATPSGSPPASPAPKPTATDRGANPF